MANTDGMKDEEIRTPMIGSGIGTPAIAEPHPGRVIRLQDLHRALADVRDNIGPQSQAAFAIEAVIRACEG